MPITDIIVVFAVLLTIGTAIAYIIKSKKSGKKCIGCPYGNACHQANKNREDCSCRYHGEEK